MKGALLLLGTLAALLPGAALAVLTVDLGDPTTHEWTVTYRFEASGVGKTSMDVLPYDYDEMEILDTAPEKGGGQLKYEAINEGEAKKPKFRILLPNPLGPNERMKFRVVARMKDPEAYFLDVAKLNFLYSTGHEINVTLPEGYLPIYTNEAMELKWEKNRVVLSSAGGVLRPVVIFGRSCD
ncbi:MAG: hypothetical protein JW958_03005 [Candidatus Eisenbacteria bacterium]|nr:hypothetical protein [Candidatus Eisenbacteria bacterium]